MNIDRFSGLDVPCVSRGLRTAQTGKNPVDECNWDFSPIIRNGDVKTVRFLTRTWDGLAAVGWKVRNASRIGENMNEFGSDWPRKQRVASIRY